MEIWETYYLNDDMLKHCESPKILRLPVGSCVRVRKGYGVAFDEGSYTAQCGYVIEDHVAMLKERVRDLKGWALTVGEALREQDWRRGWVDHYYPHSKLPVLKCVLPGMVRVELALVDPVSALASVTRYNYIPVCPTCTLEQYEDKTTRDVFDKAMGAFMYMWLYGSTGRGDGREDY